MPACALAQVLVTESGPLFCGPNGLEDPDWQWSERFQVLICTGGDGGRGGVAVVDTMGAVLLPWFHQRRPRSAVWRQTLLRQ